MFKLIKKIAAKISLHLCKTDGNEDNYDYYEYALVGYLSFIMYCIVALFFAVFFGYMPYIFVIIVCLLSLRSQSGGSHASSPLKCFFTTTIFYIVIGMSTYLNKYYLIIFLLSFVGFTSLEFVPKYTKTATQHPKAKQHFFQVNYIVRLLAVFILNLLSIILYLTQQKLFLFGFNIDFSKLSCVLSMCVIMNRFSLSDICFILLSK